MVFEVLESGEDDDFYTVVLSVQPQGDFLGRPGQEQFVVGKEGTIAVRQVLSPPARKGSGFPMLPVAIGLVVVGIIAAVSAIFLMSSSGGDSVPIAAVPPTEKPAPTQPPAPVVIPADTPEPAANIAATVEAGIQKGLAARLTSAPVPTATYTPIPSPTRPKSTATPQPLVRPTPLPTAPWLPLPSKVPGWIQDLNGVSHYNRGKEYFDDTNWEMAIDEYTKAIQLNPGLPLVYFHRGVSHTRLGETKSPSYGLQDHRNAVADYDKAIQLDPDYAPAYFYRGFSYNERGHYGVAIANYNKAIQLDPDYAVAYFYLSLHYRFTRPTLTATYKAKACSLDTQYC